MRDRRINNLPIFLARVAEVGLGQTLRKHERRNGKPAKLRITPSKASFQALKDKVRTRCKQAVGATAEALIDTLNPRLARLGKLSSPCDL